MTSLSALIGHPNAGAANLSSVIGVLQVTNGGTNATNLAGARVNLGVPDIATNAETIAGTDNTKAVSPAALQNKLSIQMYANDGVTLLGHLSV